MQVPFITVIARIKARHGKESETRSELLKLVEPTRKEDGCIRYDLHILPHDASEFLFHEHWTSEAALARHSESPHIQSFKARAQELLERPTDITIWHSIDA